LNPTQFQTKEEKVQAANDSLSEADPLSEWHPFSKASSSLSGWETLENKESEIYALSRQLTRPARTLSLLALTAPYLAMPKFTNLRLVSPAR